MGQIEAQEFVVERDGEVLVYEPLRGPWEDSTAMGRLIGWLKTNAVDHERVPLPSRASIVDGNLTVELYALDDDGQRYIDEAGEHAVRTTRTVPLVADPPDCWVRREVSAGRPPPGAAGWAAPGAATLSCSRPTPATAPSGSPPPLATTGH